MAQAGRQAQRILVWRVRAPGGGISAPVLSRRPRRTTTYRVASRSATAGRMISRGSLVAWASSSAQYGVRCPVRVSSSTIGASRSRERPMSVTGVMPLATGSRPGTRARIGVPGLKPSCRFHSAGSTCTPAVLAGSAPAAKCTRRPVGLLRSGTVNRLLGKGSRPGGSGGWLEATAAVDGATAARTATIRGTKRRIGHTPL